ncbi:hypothetical protein [Roseivirga sp.]|uniref:hypothetical protein n=1 Tax=Roseivirga sp. TaxID=1964215 RepID=UPI003B8D3067
MKIGKIKPTLLFILSLGFILFTVIGTVSHEMGHIAVAKALGYSTELHHASMTYDYESSNSRLNEIYGQYQKEIENDLDFTLKKEFDSLYKKQRTHGLLISMGGPLQTCLVGLIGFFLLKYHRKKFPQRFNHWDWLGVFFPLFWLREVYNLLTSIGSKIIDPQTFSYFGGDELNIAYYLEIWEGSVAISLGAIGLGISLLVIFKYLPHQYRLTFILSGLIGGNIGFYLWIYQLGPLVLP